MRKKWTFAAALCLCLLACLAVPARAAETTETVTINGSYVKFDPETGTILAWVNPSGAVTIPKSVTSIGLAAFDRCFSLTDVYYAGSEEDWKLIQVGLMNNPLDHTHSDCATFHYSSGGEKELSTGDSVQQVGSTVKLTFTGGALENGGKTAKVFAALDRAAILSGTYAAGEVTFQRSPERGRTLFFLDPDTLVPLAKPVVL